MFLIFRGVYLNKKYAIILPLVLMALTDVFLGVYSSIFFTWASIAAIAFIGIQTKKNKSFKGVAFGSLLSAVLFFVVTNVGVWLTSGMYSLDFSGFMNCFYLAMPFFRYTLVSTIVYSFVLFGSYELISARLILKPAMK